MFIEFKYKLLDLLADPQKIFRKFSDSIFPKLAASTARYNFSKI